MFSRITLQPFLLAALLLLAGHACLAQQPARPTDAERLRLESVKNRPKQESGAKPAVTETCNNGMDDDANGLADLKDFTCYYSSINTTCQVSKVVWSTTNAGLLWADTETGEERFVGNIDGIRMADLAWSSEGKLYGVGLSSNAIYEIDPYTSRPTFVCNMGEYTFSNAMTADRGGNLYLAASFLGGRDIIKLNIATGQVTKVADLIAAGVSSAGDLTFVDGYLYLTCTASAIARINIGTGEIVRRSTNISTDQAYGLFTIGDGHLYLGIHTFIYKMDPVTMLAELTPYYIFQTTGASTLGFSNYTEQCNANICRPVIDIDTLTPPPFCQSNGGIKLKATGSGIFGPAAYEWIIPNGTHLATDAITAYAPGWYKVRYHALPDTCGIDDSVYVKILRPPVANIGNDTTLCTNGQVRLEQLDKQDIDSYRWQDGSTQPFFIATQPGRYFLKVFNTCGTSTDTVDVWMVNTPQVSLGNDQLNCPGPIKLFNQQNKQPGDKYHWSTGATSDTIIISKAGTYWLESSNNCGRVRDSVSIDFKDSCICAPLYPAADLGADKLICAYEEIPLKNALHKPGFRYRWQNGSTEASLVPKQPGIYWVDVTTHCGTVRDSVNVEFRTQGCDRKIMFPSAFSPNNDRTNETYKPVVYGAPSRYELSIYNRWGQLVFRTSDPSRGWDGTIRGIKQQTGVFAWTCTYQFNGQEAQFRKGTLMLVQ